MNFDKLFEAIATAPKDIRMDHVKFCQDYHWDFYSAYEAIDMIIAGLTSRYSLDADLSEVEWKGEKLKIALLKAHEYDALEEEEIATRNRVNDE